MKSDLKRLSHKDFQRLAEMLRDGKAPKVLFVSADFWRDVRNQ
jgi:hypothetical protein